MSSVSRLHHASLEIHIYLFSFFYFLFFLWFFCPPIASASNAAEGRFKVLVSNLDACLTEADLRPVFAAFGDVAHLDLARGGTVGEKGTVTVQYKKRADALGAVQVFALEQRHLFVASEFF